jgi:diguanylate cyclase (GGDEF)-like protein
MTIASTVLEGGREFLLPYDSGYLKEKPLLFQNDGVRARQYFGFPLAMRDKPFGFLGFASLSARRLRENAITALGDAAVLMSLFLGRLRLAEEMEARANSDPATGVSRFSLFFDGLEQMARQKKRFSVVSIRLPGFPSFNRTFGTSYGDEILKRMSQGIECCVGKNAILTRAGGAHFYAALAGSDGLEEGQNILNVLKFTILNTLADMAAGAKREMEVGTAYFPRDGANLWELLDLAAKRGKRKEA